MAANSHRSPHLNGILGRSGPEWYHRHQECERFRTGSPPLPVIRRHQFVRRPSLPWRFSGILGRRRAGFITSAGLPEFRASFDRLRRALLGESQSPACGRVRWIVGSRRSGAWRGACLNCLRWLASKIQDRDTTPGSVQQLFLGLIGMTFPRLHRHFARAPELPATCLSPFEGRGNVRSSTARESSESRHSLRSEGKTPASRAPSAADRLDSRMTGRG